MSDADRSKDRRDFSGEWHALLNVSVIGYLALALLYLLAAIFTGLQLKVVLVITYAVGAVVYVALAWYHWYNEQKLERQLTKMAEVLFYEPSTADQPTNRGRIRRRRVAQAPARNDSDDFDGDSL